jgi:ketosteroid isomerase-like protein
MRCSPELTRARVAPWHRAGKSMETDYVYVMEFAGGKIRHLTKIWNSGVALRALGWM